MADPVPAPPTPSDDAPAVIACGGVDVAASIVSMSARSPDGDDAAYLRWHGLDHLPEQYRLSGVCHGSRWVSTPACRAARLVSDARFDAMDHLVQYLVCNPLDATLDGFFSLGRALHDAGRMPLRLPSVELGGYRFVEAIAAPRALVGAAVLPWRPNRGIELLVEQGVSPEPLRDLVDVEGVAGVWSYEGTVSMHARLAPTGGLHLHVLYVDEDPVTVADRLRGPLARRWADQALTPLLAAPMVTVVPFAWDRALP
ncbi:MAG: hypothetical protein ACR2MB_05960 [Acidimicrobiales bacterium]